MYLTRNRLGIYCYRRPVLAEDQAFWVGPSGKPKKEWGRSLRTTDRRTAIALMSNVADLYEAERADQFERAASRAAPQAVEVSERAREEQAAFAALEAARLERYRGRGELRTDRRRRVAMSTAELTPDDAAWRDLVRERDQELAAMKEAAPAQVAALTGGMGSATAKADTATIEKLIGAYEADKSPGWSGSSKKAVVPVFRILLEVFAGRDLNSINRVDARAIVKLLEELPAQIGKRPALKGLTIKQAVEKGRELALPTIGPKTINDGYLMHIAAMWNWAVKEEWVASSPFKGLSVHDPVDDADRRDPFSADQLTTLFSGAPWTAPWTTGGEKAGAYWVPLLCLFQGLRNSEAAGLRVEDIGEDDGVPVIRIRGYVGRTIKGKGARGTLPLHPEVLGIGFLAYFAERRDAGVELLFPEGTANGRGQVAAKLAERFSTHVKRLGLIGTKLGTHSFRHCFEDRLREAELVERTALALARRKEAGSSRVYGHGLSARQKAEAIAKIIYPGLDLSHLYATGTTV